MLTSKLAAASMALLLLTLTGVATSVPLSGGQQDSGDAERIREIIERLKNFDADIQHSLECTARLHKKFYR